MCAVVLHKGLGCPTWIWLGMCVPLGVCSGPETLILWGIQDAGAWTQPWTWHQSRGLCWEWGGEGQAYVDEESNPVHPLSQPLTCGRNLSEPPVLHNDCQLNWANPCPSIPNFASCAIKGIWKWKIQSD